MSANTLARRQRSKRGDDVAEWTENRIRAAQMGSA